MFDRGIRLLLARQIGPVHDLLLTAGAVRLETDVHATIGTLMWIYLGAHVFMALWHEVVGHRTLRRMFTP